MEQWSNAAMHINGCDDGLAKMTLLLQMKGESRSEFLSAAVSIKIVKEMRQQERTDRPPGGSHSISELETLLIVLLDLINQVQNLLQM
jgi:hypothetical protein